MACKIIDVYYYGSGHPDPANPVEPMCVPAEAYDSLIDNKIAPISIVLGIADIAGMAMCICYQKENQMVKLCLLAAILILVSIAVIRFCKKAKEKFIKNLSNPISNPAGFQHQGKVLDPQDPHFLLHKRYYDIRKTWTLPAEAGFEAHQGKVEADEFFGR